jgi:hypothetical protein
MSKLIDAFLISLDKRGEYISNNILKIAWTNLLLGVRYNNKYLANGQPNRNIKVVREPKSKTNLDMVIPC